MKNLTLYTLKFSRSALLLIISAMAIVSCKKTGLENTKPVIRAVHNFSLTSDSLVVDFVDCVDTGVTQTHDHGQGEHSIVNKMENHGISDLNVQLTQQSSGGFQRRPAFINNGRPTTSLGIGTMNALPLNSYKFGEILTFKISQSEFDASTDTTGSGIQVMFEHPISGFPFYKVEKDTVYLSVLVNSSYDNCNTNRNYLHLSGHVCKPGDPNCQD